MNVEKFIDKIQLAYRLKYEYRYSGKEYNGERESVASHTWAMMLLADYFMNYLEEVSPGKYNLDKAKVYEYIIYHDLVEAEVGDIDNSPESMKKRKTKDEDEKKGAIVLSKKLPKYMGDKFLKSFTDFENMTDKEAIFGKCIDVLEGQFHAFNWEEVWKVQSVDFYKSRFYRKCFDSFPELKVILEDICEGLRKKGFLIQ